MIHVTNLAAKWFKRELRIDNGSAVRFYVRYGAHSQFQPGFALALSVEDPAHVALSTEVGGIQFFIQENDAWYLQDCDFIVSYNGWEDDIRFEFASTATARAMAR